jgi:hypothetical protein
MWDKLPSQSELLKNSSKDISPLKVNAHLHTPHSFSAFNSIDQALDMSAKENVPVVGINDFNTMEGYAEWAQECSKRKLFPLFNVEFISLNKADQQAGIRVNDPNNPGRTYLSGKGLSFPQNLKEPYKSQITELQEESNKHAARMCAKLNDWLHKIDAGFEISFAEIEKTLTRGNVRERHLAKALREKVKSKYPVKEAQLAFWEKLFGGKSLKSAIDNDAAIENEIRGNLLKSGGAAFVPEDPKGFLEMNIVCELILNAGGIPTYPFLADDAKGEFTDFEKEKEKVATILKERGIWSIEFITTRNSVEVLEDYAGYFYNQGFVVTIGSEHNTPAMEPITLAARNNTPLTPKLMEINYKGACVVAAHQYLLAKEGKGYVDITGKPDVANRTQFETLGNVLIQYFIK